MRSYRLRRLGRKNFGPARVSPGDEPQARPFSKYQPNLATLFRSVPRASKPMPKAPMIVLLSLALAGCAGPTAQWASQPEIHSGRYAWDGAGADPNRQARRTAISHQAVNPDPANAMASLPPADGVDQAKAAEDEAESHLRQALVICRGCLKSPANDTLLADTPQRTAAN